MLKYLQLPFHFDADRMREDVRSLDKKTWQLHYQKLHYEGEWSAIPLRSVGGQADNIIIAPQENAIYQNTLFLQACPYLQTVLQTFKCPLQAVRLLKLNAGAIIKEHHDAELNFEKGEIRIHIPVITHDDVEFYLDSERMNLKEGDCWYMNFNLKHSIINNSKINRIHLVIDALVNDWVAALFAQPALNKKEIAEKGIDPETKKLIIAQLRQLDTDTSNRMADEMEASL